MAPTMTVKRISVLFLALFICTVYRAEAQTVTAASCNASDVQAAFNAVTSSTTTVNIPACSGGQSWTTQVTLTIPSGSTTLSVIGAGSLTTTGGGDQTVIVDNYASNNSLLVITTNSNSAAHFRLAGITLKGGSGSVKYGGIVGVAGNSANFRFDHDHVSSATYSPAASSSGVRANGCIYGVVDHSIFDAPSASVNNAIQQDNAGTCNSDSLGIGDQSWAHATQLGTANFLYAENNVFNSGAANDCTWGGRYVMRFNTFNMTGTPPSVQTHPTGGAGRIRGCRAWEIYQNNFDAVAGNLINALFWVSSGTGVVWGNTVPSSSSGGGTGYKTFIELNSMRTNNATYGQTSPPNGWGYCGTGSGSSIWDQNLDSTGRHCLDQPGMGQGDLLQGGFTSDGSGSNNLCDLTSGQCSTPNYNGSWPNEAVEPIYEWSDAVSPVPSNPFTFIGSNSSFTNTFVANADYYTWCNASSQSGCTSFTGATGVGSGTRAARPSTCTKGVAYWSTDQGSWNTSGSGGQGVLDLCTATNTWTNGWYTPYTYPHPLDTSNAGPPPPVNVQAIFP